MVGALHSAEAKGPTEGEVGIKMRHACVIALALRVAPLLRAQAQVEAARHDVLVLGRHAAPDVRTVLRGAAAADCLGRRGIGLGPLGNRL